MTPELFGLGFGLGFFALIGLMICVGVGLFALWLWMLIDCAQAPENPADPNQRIVWILILVFTGWIGAALYFFIVRQPRLTAQAGRQGSAPTWPPAPPYPPYPAVPPTPAPPPPPR